jgi:hypothetical protein
VKPNVGEHHPCWILYMSVLSKYSRLADTVAMASDGGVVGGGAAKDARVLVTVEIWLEMCSRAPSLRPRRRRFLPTKC